MAVRALERFSETVDAIYAASLNPELWQNAVGAIAQQHRAPMANLLTPTTAPPEGGFIFSVGIPESALQLWGSKFVAHDVWAQRVVKDKLAVEGAVFTGSELVADDELERSYFYREFLRHQDIYHLCTGIVFDGRNAPLTAMSLFRPQQKPFDDMDRRLYKLTVNHVSRSLGTMLLLRNAELQVQATLASLDRFDTAVVLLGSRGNALFANKSAHAVFRDGDGLKLRAGNPVVDAEGWITAMDPRIDARLTRFFKDCLDPLADADHFNHAVLVERPSGRRPYVVQASALSSGNRFQGQPANAGAIVFISDSEQNPTVSIHLLRTVYGLTLAEANLARELIRGDGLAAAAERLRVSENTAKTQLAAIYEKTRTHRQAELVKLLYGLASRRMDDPAR